MWNISETQMLLEKLECCKVKEKFNMIDLHN